MGMNYEELDELTRKYMFNEFEAEQNSNHPYLSKALNNLGNQIFPSLMRDAIVGGNEVTLTSKLLNPTYWKELEDYTRKGITRQRIRNVQQSAERLAISEFSTWYVRGFAKRLLDEGEIECEVYRGSVPKWEPGDCTSHEGQIVSVQLIYDNHRLRYWPEPGNPNAFSIPFSPGCHHLIKRILK